jgi:hypothetical protein
MSVHPVPGLPGISVSIPGLDVENVSGRHDEPSARTIYPAPPRGVPTRVQVRRRVQETVDAASGARLDESMRRQLQIVADDQADPNAYHYAKDMARNLAASDAMDRASARERVGPGAYIPSAGSRLPYLFGAVGR